MRFRAKSHHQINALQPLIRKKVDNQQLSFFYFSSPSIHGADRA